MTPEEVLALSQRRWAAVKADADALAYRRVQNAETARRARANNPESAREAHKRWYAKLKADSERYAAYLENRRIQHRLRQERLGRPVTRSVKTAMGAYKLSAGTTDRRLDVEPLGTWVDVVLAQEVPDRGRGRGGSGSSRDDRSRTMEDLSAELGIEDRVLYRIEHRVFGTVTLGVADRMLTRFDRPVFLDGRRIEQALEQRCREMPGNGERILRYIDLAERIAHLDGAVVERVEDLWPELESAG